MNVAATTALSAGNETTSRSIHMSLHSISSVSRKTGLSARTLRYYERLGLLEPTFCDSRGHRFYDSYAVRTICTLQMCAALGRTLSLGPTGDDIDELTGELIHRIDVHAALGAQLRNHLELVAVGPAASADDEIFALIRDLLAWRM